MRKTTQEIAKAEILRFSDRLMDEVRSMRNVDRETKDALYDAVMQAQLRYRREM